MFLQIYEQNALLDDGMNSPSAKNLVIYLFFNEKVTDTLFDTWGARRGGLLQKSCLQGQEGNKKTGGDTGFLLN
jgi:hypothetical protein